MNRSKSKSLDSPKASIITTIYNRESLVKDSINSVLQSSFSDFEYILVDDASTDRSYEVVESYGKLDARIKIYRNEKNLGDYPNRNKAASYAKGKYIKYVDSDDTLEPDAIGKMVDYMESNPGAAFGVEVEKKHLNGNDFMFLTSKVVMKKSFIEGAFMLSGPTGAIFNRSIFEKMGRFGGNPYVGSDTIYFLRTASQYPIVIFNKGLVNYRIHSNQEFDLRKKDYYLRNYREYKNIINNPEVPLIPSERKNANLKLKKLLISQSIRFLLNGNFRFFKYTFIDSGFMRDQLL